MVFERGPKNAQNCCLQIDFALNDTLLFASYRSEQVNKHQKLKEAQQECHQYTNV